MTIAIRNNWNGNDPHAVFESVTEAIPYVQTNPSYEIIRNDVHVRPFGDIDYHTPENISLYDFHLIDSQIYCQFTELFESIGRKICLVSGSDYDAKKISWRWYIPDVYVASVKHAKLFAEKIYGQLELPAGIVPDYSVYSSNRKMRMVGTCKPNETRHLQIHDGTLEDTFITHIPVDAEFIDLELPQRKEHTPNVQVVEESRLTAVCDLIGVNHFQEYNSCLAIIWALCSSGATPELIHQYCSKASNYEAKWVDDAIGNWNSSKSPSFGTLVHYVDDKSKIPRDPNAQIPKPDPTEYLKELTQLTTNHTTIFDWCTSRGFLKPLPAHRTLAVKSHMSTGKTREMIRICRQAISEGKNVCILSARRSWATTIHAELPTFVDYRDQKKGHIAQDKNIIMQIQSIHRLEGNTYDYILFDECESLLASLSPNQTHKHYINTIKVFEHVVKSAHHVIALDAFLTDRSVSMLQVLRGDVQIVINPTIPFKNTCVIYKSEIDYHSTLRQRLEQKKRIMSFWGTKKLAIGFHNRIPESIPNVLYHGDSNEKIKQQHFADVNKYWAEHQFVGYTTTITIGLNYTAEPLFDQCSFNASAWSCISRDVIQALHRARKLKDTHLFGYIDPRGRPIMSDCGMENQWKSFYEVSERKRAFLKEIGEKLDNYEELPTWLKHVLVWNRNEIVMNAKYFRECMMHYLQLSGVTITTEGEEEARETSKDKRHIPDVNTIPDIDHVQAQIYQVHQKSLTEEEKYALEKFYLRDKVVCMNQEIWEIWVRNRVWIQRTYMQMNSNATIEVNRQEKKIAELVSHDVEKLNAIQRFDFDFSKSWTIPVEELKQISLECFHLRKRTDKDTPEQYARDVSKAFKSWNGTDLKVIGKRVRIESGALDYTYKLEYNVDSNPIYSAIISPRSMFES